MAIIDSSRFVGARDKGFPVHTALLLLAIAMAICLAVADVFYVPVSPEAAAAVALDRWLTPASAPTASKPPVPPGKERVHESKRRR